jgi:hypothetical protein
MWARPRMPFEDIISGTRQGGGFNPGGYFGPAKPATPGYGFSTDDMNGPGGGSSVVRNVAGTSASGGHDLPSLQRWGKLAPTEQAMQTGIWKDEGQIAPEDVFSLMNKLRPKTATSFAPRWMG